MQNGSKCQDPICESKFGLVWFYSISNNVDYLMPNPFYTYTLNIWFVKIFWFLFLNEPKQIPLHLIKWFQVLLCITNKSIKCQSFVYTQLNIKKVLFLTIQLGISHLFAKGQSQPQSDGNEGALHIPQSLSIIGASPSDYWCHIQTLVDGGVLPLSRDTALANWAIYVLTGRPGFNPRSSHTKDSKTGTWCLPA